MAPSANKVFVVHGHDGEMKQYVARVLDKLGLNPVILHEQNNAGKTIIEKFIDNSDVSFAVVLLSPDDKGYPASASAKSAKSRARQNVILELGFFIGKLGRDRVFTLKQSNDLEIPSDFAGVLYTLFDSAGQWRFELVRELQAAGYAVDANKLLV
jgi:predicted nucleotide-binding protein